MLKLTVKFPIVIMILFVEVNLIILLSLLYRQYIKGKIIIQGMKLIRSFHLFTRLPFTSYIELTCIIDEHTKIISHELWTFPNMPFI